MTKKRIRKKLLRKPAENFFSKMIKKRSDQSRLIVIDEVYKFLGAEDDVLKKELRKVDGIPNATYVVTGDRVFVFAKLVKDVKERLMPGVPLEELARSLVPKTTISAEEAVNQWDIIPEPYSLESGKKRGFVIRVPEEGTGFVIRHQPFNALIPGVFPTKEAANNVLAVLLISDDGKLR